jgi:ABC-type bacteriocin/lantibiotic exporter with double-glycine peptidase domain
LALKFSREIVTAGRILGRRTLAKYLLCILLQFLNSFFDILFLILITTLATSFLSGYFQDSKLLNHFSRDLSTGTLLFILLTTVVIKNIFSILLQGYFRNLLALRESELSTSLIQKSLFQKLDKMKLTHSSELLLVSANLTENLFTNLYRPIAILSGDIATVISLSIGIFMINPNLGSRIFLYFLVIGVIFGLFYTKRNNRIGKNLVSQNSDWLKTYNEIKVSRTEIKLARLEDSYISQIFDEKKKLTKTRATAILLQNVPRYFLEVAAILGLLLAYLFLQKSHTKLQIASSLALLLGAGFRFLPSVNSILVSLGNLKNALPSLERYTMLNDELSIVTGSQELRIPYRTQGLLDFAGDLVVENIEYGYPDSKVKIIENLSFNLEQNKSLLITGQNGSGKSTLLSLLTGLITPDQGRVYIKSGSEKVDMHSDRVLGIRYLGQDFALLDKTIAFNISLQTAEQINLKNLELATEKAGILKFVGSLENGFDTLIGENGELLSGGQRQRIGLARCLYSNPGLIVLDEPTSSLDRESEIEFWNTIEEINGMCTIIIISHAPVPQNIVDMEISIGEAIKVVEA